MRITASLLFSCSYLLISYLYSCLRKGTGYPCSIVLYQFSGAVFIGCALILLHPLLFHEKYSRKYLFWAGMFLSFSFFCAISYAVSIFLIILMAGIFFVCNFRQSAKEFSTLMFFVYGGITGLLLVLFYLLVFGSVRGFIDQHILFNLQVYSKYIMAFQGYDESISGYTGKILRIPEQVLRGSLFYLALLTIFVLLYPLSYFNHAGKKKRTILHFVFCVMIFLVALFSGRASPFDDGFVPQTQSGYVILILAECALLSSLVLGRAWFIIAIGFITLLIEKAPLCRIQIPGSDSFLMLKQREIPPAKTVQDLTGQEDPVLFYPLGFSDYIGVQRLPGGVSFPFMTSWTYEYGRGRLFAEIRKTMPVIIYFNYSDKVWYQDDAMISEFLDFIRSEGYMQIQGTDYFILPERCSRRNELARYELVPIARQYQNADPFDLYLFDEINRSKQYCGYLVYPDKLKDRMVTGISIPISTYYRSGSQLDGELEVMFLDERDQVIEVFTMDCADLIDNQRCVFSFERPCHPVSIRISSTSSPDKGVTVWVDSRNQLYFGAIADPVSLPRTIRRGSASVPSRE